MPSSPTGFELASIFANFFDTKILLIRVELDKSWINGDDSVIPVLYFNVV